MANRKNEKIQNDLKNETNKNKPDPGTLMALNAQAATLNKHYFNWPENKRRQLKKYPQMRK